jgi:hypothetical protein
MKKVIFLTSIFVLLVSCSNSNKDPQSVAISFYNYLSQEDFESAKSLCTPTASEYVDNIKNYNDNLNDLVAFEPMDIVKKDKPVEGDTAIVNYKIGKFTSTINLVFVDKSYKIIHTTELKQLIPKEYNSLELFNDYNNDRSVFKKKYLGVRFKVTDLLGGRYLSDNIIGIPYNVEENSTPINNIDRSPYGGKDFDMVYNGEVVKSSSKDKKTDDFFLTISSLIDPDDMSSIKKYDESYPNGYGNPSLRTFPHLYDFTGVFYKTLYDDLYFKNCEITIR